MEDKRYKFECGCVDIGKMHHRRICCPEHKARIKNRIVVCDNCGNEYERSTRGGYSLVKHCALCKSKLTGKDNNQKKNRRSRKGMKYKKTDPILGKKECIRYEDCAYYNQCITPPDGKLFKEAKSCFSCKQFEPAAPLDIMDYVTAKSYFQEIQTR